MLGMDLFKCLQTEPKLFPVPRESVPYGLVNILVSG